MPKEAKAHVSTLCYRSRSRRVESDTVSECRGPAPYLTNHSPFVGFTLPAFSLAAEEVEPAFLRRKWITARALCIVSNRTLSCRSLDSLCAPRLTCTRQRIILRTSHWIFFLSSSELSLLLCISGPESLPLFHHSVLPLPTCIFSTL